MSVRGIPQVKRKLSATLENVAGGRTNAAIYAILSQGAALSDTMTPVDTGTLVNSRFQPRIERRASSTVGEVGYTARYAAAVHAAPGKLKGLPRPGNRGDHWDPDGEPKFLEKGFEALKPSIPAILREVYRV